MIGRDGPASDWVGGNKKKCLMWQFEDGTTGLRSPKKMLNKSERFRGLYGRFGAEGAPGVTDDR